MNRARGRRGSGVASAACALALVVSGCASISAPDASRTPTASASVAFPTFAPGQLTAGQGRLVAVIKAEYLAQPPGTKYSQGADESWCADFVSWVEHSAGTPLRNPNSGGWRIPGTMTMLDYFRSRGVWHAYGSGYTPVVGDVAIFDGSGPFGQHANFVLGYRGGVLTTVGGAEPGGIRVSDHRLDTSLTVLGFAHLTR